MWAMVGLTRLAGHLLELPTRTRSKLICAINLKYDLSNKEAKENEEDIVLYYLA